MRALKNKTVVIALTAAVIVSAIIIALFSSFAAAKEPDSRLVLSDGSGYFIDIRYNESKYIITKLRPDGGSSVIAQDSICLKLASVCGKRLIVVSNNRINELIMIYDLVNGAVRSVMLPRLKSDPVSACIDEALNCYITEASKPRIVTIYNRNGSLTGSADAGAGIHTLFQSSGHVFAMTDKGTFDITDQRFVGGDVLQGSLEQNGIYCCDSYGGAYEFSPSGGFSKLSECKHEHICATGDELYAADGNMIYRLSADNVTTGYYMAGSGIDRITASGKIVAFLTADSLTILDRSSIIPISDPQQSSSPLRSGVRPGGSASEAQVSASPVYHIRSTVFTISGNKIISYKAGVTLAGFKKDIDHGDYSVSALDHNGNALSSGTPGTGSKLIFTGGGKALTYTVIVKGDVTGEGNVNSRDHDLISEYLLGLSEPDDITRLASDVDNDGNLTIADFYKSYTGS